MPVQKGTVYSTSEAVQDREVHILGSELGDFDRTTKAPK